MHEVPPLQKAKSEVISSIKFRKGFAKFMIPIAMFKKIQFISSVEVSNMARCGKI